MPPARSTRLVRTVKSTYPGHIRFNGVKVTSKERGICPLLSFERRTQPVPKNIYSSALNLIHSRGCRRNIKCNLSPRLGWPALMCTRTHILSGNGQWYNANARLLSRQTERHSLSQVSYVLEKTALAHWSAVARDLSMPCRLKLHVVRAIKFAFTIAKTMEYFTSLLVK